MGRTWWEAVSCTLGSCIIIIHIVALIFLKISKYSNRHKNQVLIITSLSIRELTGTVLLIGYFLFTYFELLVMADIAFCFTKTFTPISFHFIMILLAIDTFLVFYLKLKYSLYFSPWKVRKIILCFVLHSLLTTVTFVVLISLQTITLLQMFDVLYILCLILDVGCIFLTVQTYIFQVYRRHLNFKKTSQISGGKDRFKILMPTLIIATFILFNIIPNIINANYSHEIYSFDKKIVQVALIIFGIGWLVNPLIRIFCSSCSDNFKKFKKEKRRISLLRNKHEVEMKKIRKWLKEIKFFITGSIEIQRIDLSPWDGVYCHCMFFLLHIRYLHKAVDHFTYKKGSSHQ